MTANLDNTAIRPLTARCGPGWAGPVLGALGLNLALFMLMPYLLDPAPAGPAYDKLLPDIQVIRFKRPETLVSRKPPEPVPAKKTAAKSRAQESALAEDVPRPTWAFDINPRLPALPADMALPVAPIQMEKAPAGPHLFGISELDRPLTTLVRLPPIYPTTAKSRGIKGWVEVAFVVNEQGRAEDITITRAQPPEVFNDSVMRCVSGWRFEPGTVQGRPVRVRAETTVRFVLD